MNEWKFTTLQRGTGFGGAIAFLGDGVVTRSTFEGNNGLRGGAIYVKSATVHISECTFKDNDGSGVGAQTTAGVAVYVEGTSDAPGIALVAGVFITCPFTSYYSLIRA